MPADPLADDFAELPAVLSRCPLGRILDDPATTPKARAGIENALTLVDPQSGRHVASVNWIVTRLKKNGRKISKEAVGQHRNGSCRCAA